MRVLEGSVGTVSSLLQHWQFGALQARSALWRTALPKPTDGGYHFFRPSTEHPRTLDMAIPGSSNFGIVRKLQRSHHVHELVVSV